jgi:hypothetical protein
VICFCSPVAIAGPIIGIAINIALILFLYEEKGTNYFERNTLTFYMFHSFYHNGGNVSSFFEGINPE